MRRLENTDRTTQLFMLVAVIFLLAGGLVGFMIYKHEHRPQIKETSPRMVVTTPHPETLPMPPSDAS